METWPPAGSCLISIHKLEPFENSCGIFQQFIWKVLSKRHIWTILLFVFCAGFEKYFPDSQKSEKNSEPEAASKGKPAVRTLMEPSNQDKHLR